MLLDQQGLELAFGVFLGPQGKAVEPCLAPSFAYLTRWAPTQISTSISSTTSGAPISVPVPTAPLYHVPEVSLDMPYCHA